MCEIEDSSAKAMRIPLAFLGHSDILVLIENGSLKIEPFIPELLSCNKIDLRISNELIRLKSTNYVFDIEERDDCSRFFQKESSSEFIINPNEKVLMCTIEKLRLPTNILGIVSLKSSFSRLGLQSNLGLVDPGFAGQLTLEVSGSSFPIRLRSEESVFHMALAGLGFKDVHEYSGKYQNQKGPTLPRFRNRL